MSDSMATTVLTVDADGRVSADFEGHVHASGVDLDAAVTGTPLADEKVRWLVPGTGDELAFVAGYGLADPIAELAAHAVGDEALAKEFARLVVGLGGAGWEAAAFTPGGGVKIIDELGQSSFVQLLAEGEVAIDFGSEVVKTNAEGIGSVTVAHGLGRDPELVIPFVMASGLALFSLAGTDTYTFNNFHLGVRNLFGVGVAEVLVGWIAIG